MVPTLQHFSVAQNSQETAISALLQWQTRRWALFFQRAGKLPIAGKIREAWPQLVLVSLVREMGTGMPRMQSQNSFEAISSMGRRNIKNLTGLK